MALFRRNQPTTEIPELKEYYEAQKRDNPAKAWLLAIISLLVTIGVVLGLLFGGRWLYRTLFDEDSPSTGSNQTINQGADSSDATGDSDAAHQDEAEDEHDESTSQTSPTTTPTTVPGSDDTDEDASSSTPQTTTPATGALPSTGPGDVLAIFVVTVLIGYLASNLYSAKKNQ